MLSQGSSAPTWVYCGNGADRERLANLENAGAVVKMVKTAPDGKLDLQSVLKDLGDCGITTLLVEGGGKVHASFVKLELYDQANLFIAPMFIGSDGKAAIGELDLKEVGQAGRFRMARTRRFGDDVMIEGFFNQF